LEAGKGGGWEGTRGTLNEAHQPVPRTQNYSVFANATNFKFFKSKNKYYILKIFLHTFKANRKNVSLLSDVKELY